MLQEGGWTPNELYNVELKIYNSDKCSGVLPDLTKNWGSQICAGKFSYEIFLLLLNKG